jgi:hypothetical protein
MSQAFVQFVADIALNQQGNEGADFGVVELGRHPNKTFVHLLGVESVGELFVDLVNDVPQVCVDLEPTLGI